MCNALKKLGRIVARYDQTNSSLKVFAGATPSKYRPTLCTQSPVVPLSNQAAAEGC
jgi:hypothetical protein